MIAQNDDRRLVHAMQAYAEAEGTWLLQQLPDAPDIPLALDAKYQAMIEQEWRKGTRRRQFAYTLRKLGTTAAAFAMVLGICASMAAAAELVRPPEMELQIKHSGTHSSFTIVDGDKTFTYPEGKPTVDRSASPLEEFLPEEYELQILYHHEGGGFLCSYYTPEGRRVTFDVGIADGVTNFDTEDAIVTEVSILGHKCIMVEKNGFDFYWLDQELVVMYSLHLNDWEYEEAWALLETIAACPDWVYLI